MKRIPLPILFVFIAVSFILIRPTTQTCAYQQGTCGQGSLCVWGKVGKDVVPGYQCIDGYVFGQGGGVGSDNGVPSCITTPDNSIGPIPGLCCDPGTPKPTLPPHDGYVLGGGTPACAPTSICYTGDTLGDNNLYPGHQCGTLKDWHYGMAGSIVPKCGLGGAYCCDAGNAATITPIPTAPPAPCNMNGQNNCVSVSTGFGNIPTNITAAISSAFGILLSFTGGILLIIIVFSGYRIMTSQGDAEKIKGARETLTSAIVGFLFIVFSITILKIIGVDILHIPGLTK